MCRWEWHANHDVELELYVDGGGLSQAAGKVPPSGKWKGTFTSQHLGTHEEEQEYIFHSDGRLTGSIQNPFVQCDIVGTYDSVTGAFTYVEQEGHTTVKGTV